MLFDMGQVGTPDFWMKDMRFPLDMVWIDANKHVAGVTSRRAAPARCPR